MNTEKEFSLAEQTKKRILVVEDDQDVQDMIRILLERAGYETIPALNVPAAVEILRGKTLPDIVLLDLMLPGVSGLELLKQMREKTYFDKLPVVIVSALADPEKIREGLDAGADRYVTKPGIPSNLITTVHTLVRDGRPKPA
jgi:two-component system, OmpR family, phosphate regulon response regulator PhoB